MGFTFIEANLCATLRVSIKQPIDDKECPFNPSYFTKGNGQIMLAWVSGKLSQELTWWHDTGHHGGRTAQDIWPVCYDRAFPDFAANQPLQFFWNAAWIKDIQTF